jgi:hypothetical protein
VTTADRLSTPSNRNTLKNPDTRSSTTSAQKTSSNNLAMYNDASAMFIPCTNCNNMIHYDEIGILKLKLDNHSNNCVRVKEEVIVAEGSNFTYHTIDHKLRKLEEHLTCIKNQDSSGKGYVLTRS